MNAVRASNSSTDVGVRLISVRHAMNRRKVLVIVLSPIIGGLVYICALSQGSLLASLRDHATQILWPTFCDVVLAAFAFEVLVLLPASLFLVARGAGPFIYTNCRLPAGSPSLFALLLTRLPGPPIVGGS